MTPNWEFKQTEPDYTPPSGPRGEYTFTDEEGLRYRVYTSYGDSRWHWYVIGVLTPSGFSIMASGEGANAIEAKVRAELAGKDLWAHGIGGRVIPATAKVGGGS